MKVLRRFGNKPAGGAGILYFSLLLFSLFFLPTGLPAVAQSGDEADPIKIGVLANRGAEICLQEWGPTADYLSAELAPLTFEIVPLDFDEIFTAVSERQVSYIAANPSYYTYLEYYGLANRIVTLQLPGEPEPQPLFGGVIFTRSDRGDINTVEDLRGKKFAAVNENSLGGWHAALREILLAGITPEEDFAAMLYSGTHDNVALAVLSGEVDAGTVRSSQLERMAGEGLLSLDDLKLINDQSGRYPGYPYLLSTVLYPEWPFAALTGVDAELSRMIAVALLMMDWQDPAAVAIRGAGWAVAQDYWTVHELLRELGLPPYDQTQGVTLAQVFRQYWPWIALFMALLVVSWFSYWRVSLLSRQLKEISEQRRVSEAQSRALIKAIPDMLFRYSRDGTYLDAEVKDSSLMHPATRKLYLQQELVGKKVGDLLPPQIAETLLDRIEKSLQDNRVVVYEYSYEIEHEMKHFESRLAATENNQVVSIVRDITAEKCFNDELKYISFHDPLTGLYNRSYFENEMERLDGSREYPIVIISADLDGLKLINDTFGHKEGDDYLRAGAVVLKESIRKSDLVARVGGDEFVLILPRTRLQFGEEMVERIRQKMDEYNSSGEHLPLSISLGAGESTTAQLPLEEAYIAADRVMYSDKLQRSPEARSALIRALLANIYQREYVTVEHGEKVQELAIRMGQEVGLSEQKMADLVMLTQVYELGKAVIDQELLRKPGRLTEAEWEIIRQHPEKGYRIASASPDLASVADLILKHHENWDGSGYPLGIKGTEIPVESRILAVVNAYCAMVGSRYYAPRFSENRALYELKLGSGKQFDPELVEHFTAIVESA